MLRNYLKMAVKVLLRRKFYTFISLFGIAFTMLVLLVATALFDNTFGPLSPESRQDRIATIYFVHLRGKENRQNSPPGYDFLNRYVRRLPGFEQFTIHSSASPVISYRNGATIESDRKYADGTFWQIFDFDFLEGGPYTEQDEKNRNFVAVINEATRRRFFGSAPAVGRTIEFDGQTFRVVGVVRDVPGLRITTFADIWVPISTNKSDAYLRTTVTGPFFGTVLARSPQELVNLQQTYRDLLPRMELPRGYDTMHSYLGSVFAAHSAMLFREYSETAARRVAAILIGLVVLFMLLPTVNLVNINVSRILERTSEIGVRKAFGASAGTLAGQFLTENLVLTLVGSVAGLLGAFVALRILNDSGFLTHAQLHINYRVLGYGLLLALLFGLLSGVYPAWRMSRLHAVQALRGGIA